MVRSIFTNLFSSISPPEEASADVDDLLSNDDPKVQDATASSATTTTTTATTTTTTTAANNGTNVGTNMKGNKSGGDSDGRLEGNSSTKDQQIVGKKEKNVDVVGGDGNTSKKLTKKQLIQRDMDILLDEKVKNVEAVQDIMYDEELNCLTFTFQSSVDHSVNVSMMIPENYPKETTYTILYGEDSNLLEVNNCDHLVEAFEKCIDFLEKKLSNDHSELDDERSEIVIAMNNTTGDEMLDDCYYNTDELVNMFSQELNEIMNGKKKDVWYGEFVPTGKESVRLNLAIEPNARLKISPLTAGAWGIDLEKYISIIISFNTHYSMQDRAPDVKVFQSGSIENSSVYRFSDKKTFGMCWIAEQRIQSVFYKDYWPLSKLKEMKKKKNISFLSDLLIFLEDSILNSTKFCIICGDTLPYEGIKPTVCSKQLCTFSHEQYGLGVDLVTVLKHDSDIVDLLITMASAASNATGKSNFNPFDPFPNIEVKRGDKTYSFDNKNSKVGALIEKLPTVSTMKMWAEDGTLRDKLDEIDPLAYPLIRWILCSNRSHLKKLKPSEQIKQMNTQHQYYLLNAPPQREKRFQELKKQYGSFYAFHGSALCNWHAILRSGLRNMSGTAGQANGAAYGSGVYLAENSSTSFSYMKYNKGWKNSMFGSSNLGCLAMCELINHPDLKGMPNPYYVVRKEEIIMTRYFFYYPNSGNASVSGKSIKPPPVLNY